MPAHRTPSRRPAFTLLELILVLLVITIALGVAAPQLRGWSRGSRLRDSADQFIALTRLARTLAVSAGQVHRVSLDAGTRRCVVAAQNGEQFVEVRQGGGTDGSFTLAEGVSVQMTDLQGVPRDFIEFYPNGRTQTGRMRASLDDGDHVDVECTTPSEAFHQVVTAGGAR